MMYSDYTTLS